MFGITPCDSYDQLSPTLIRMSGQHEMIDHIVFIKFKPDVVSTKVSAMIDAAKGLASLNLSINVSAGKVLRCKSTSTSTSSDFTHIFRCCFRSLDDLKAYSTHPDHLRLATDTIQIVEDNLVADWISNGFSDSPKPGSAMRVTLLKLHEDLISNEKNKLVDQVMKGLKNKFKAVKYVSFGEIFSNDLTKGYSIAIMAVFPGIADLEALNSDSDSDVETEVKDLIESELVVDYVFPLLMDR